MDDRLVVLKTQIAAYIEDVVDHAGYCIGSCHGDWSPLVAEMQARVRADVATFEWYRRSMEDSERITRDMERVHRQAGVETADVLSRGVDSAVFVRHDPVNEDILSQILEGICASKQTPRKVKQYAGCA